MFGDFADAVACRANPDKTSCPGAITYHNEIPACVEAVLADGDTTVPLEPKAEDYRDPNLASDTDLECTRTAFQWGAVTEGITGWDALGNPTENGDLLVNGLRFNPVSQTPTTFYLVESEPPPGLGGLGYRALAEPLAFTVTGRIGEWDSANQYQLLYLDAPRCSDGSSATQSDCLAAGGVWAWDLAEPWNLEAQNLPEVWTPQLPLTGANGTGHLTVIGICLLAALALGHLVARPSRRTRTYLGVAGASPLPIQGMIRR